MEESYVAYCNAYEVLVDGNVSMRERKGLKAAREVGGQDL